MKKTLIVICWTIKVALTIPMIAGGIVVLIALVIWEVLSLAIEALTVKTTINLEYSSFDDLAQDTKEHFDGKKDMLNPDQKRESKCHD